MHCRCRNLVDSHAALIAMIRSSERLSKIEFSHSSEYPACRHIVYHNELASLLELSFSGTYLVLREDECLCPIWTASKFRNEAVS